MSQLSILKTITKNLWVYEVKCRRRGHHEPIKKELEEFVKNAGLSKISSCIDCESPLELQIDEDDDNIYWISEI